MMDELKTCPFCGESAVIDDYNSSIRRDAKPLYGVACNSNGCPANELAVLNENKAQAIAAWNTRTPNTRGRKTMSECEAMVDWLRKQAGLAEEQAINAHDRDDATYLYNKDSALNEAADAIERGEHLQEQSNDK